VSSAQAGGPSTGRLCRKFRITGTVQGVWFRESTRREAQALGLEGHAINLADGSVEVIAAGGRDAVDKLSAWLRHGPPLARVEDVEMREIPDPGIRGFSTR